MKTIAISGRAIMDIVALIGRYIPKLTYFTTSQVIISNATPMPAEIR